MQQAHLSIANNVASIAKHLFLGVENWTFIHDGIMAALISLRFDQSLRVCDSSKLTLMFRFIGPNTVLRPINIP